MAERREIWRPAATIYSRAAALRFLQAVYGEPVAEAKRLADLAPQDSCRNLDWGTSYSSESVPARHGDPRNVFATRCLVLPGFDAR